MITAAPVGSWPTRMMNTMAVRGFPTVDLRGQQGPQMVSIDQIVSLTRSGFQAIEPRWAEVGVHIAALKPLGVQTLSMLAHDQKIDIYLGRNGAASIAEVKEYMAGLESWLARMSELLPKIKPDAQTNEAIDTLSSAAGNAIGAVIGGSQATTVIKLILTAIAEAQGQGSCVTVHTMVNAGQVAAAWPREDLITDRLEGIANRQWLWLVDTHTVIPCNDSFDVFQFHPPTFTVGDFTAAVRAVTG